MRHKFLLLVLGTGLLVGGSALILSTSRGHEATPQNAPPAPKVTVAPVEQRELVEWDEFTGRVEPVEMVEVRPRVSGHIQEVRFQSGELVHKDDVLFVIDPRWQQAELARREAELQEAQVRLQNAEREAARTAQLMANHAISLEESEARQARLGEAKAALLAAQAARDLAKLDLDYTQIRSPINGRVSRALVTTGNYVSGVAGQATVLTTIVSVDPVYVYADVDENTLLKFNALMRSQKLIGAKENRVPVELQLSDEDGFPHQGFIESFDNRLDPNTGSILLRAEFPNADGHIVPGLYARIRVPLSERYDALLISENAVATDQSQKFVLTLSPSNTVEYCAVKLGPEVEGKRIVRSGLKPGDKVVVNGMQRVRPGMPVTAETLAAAKAEHAQVANR
jgi:RND family efflux transporter MFP subunit